MKKHIKKKSIKTRQIVPLFIFFALLISLVHPASAELLHRYSFSEDPGSTVVIDSVSSSNGVARQISPGAVPAGILPTFDGNRVLLDGAGGYIDLPNGIVSSLTNITIEMWVIYGGGLTWQRFFDIGSITNQPGGPGGLEDTDGTLRGGQYWGTRYLFATPNGADSGQMRFAASADHFNAERPILIDPLPFPADGSTEVHVAVTYGPSGARLFYDGEQVASAFVENFVSLSDIEDVNVWLGRALYGGDPMFSGYFNEFRIHNHLLKAQELRASTVAGPDTLNFDPGTPQGVTITLVNSMLVGGVQVPELFGTFSEIGTIAISSTDLTALASSDTNVIIIDEQGRVAAVGPGNATVTATLGDQTAQTTINVSQGVPELKHRYSFDEVTGATTVTDSVGGMHGAVFAGPTGTNIIFGTGQADFPGANSYVNAAYIDLPDGMISSKTNITIEAWFTWRVAANNTRIFDFGNSTKGSNPNAAGNGLDYMFLTPRSAANQGMRFAGRPGDTGGENPNLVAPLAYQPPLNQQVHVAVVFAPSSRFSRIYFNGLPVATGDAPWQLSELADVNNWIGISQWNDPIFDGLINELRIHEGTLNDLNIALSRHAGPDALPVEPGNLVSVSLQSPHLLVGSPGTAQATLRGRFQNVTNVEITGLSGVQFQSLDTNIFAVSALGALTPRNIGTAALVGSYQGHSATTMVSVLAPVALTINVTGPIYAGGANTTLPLLADFPGGNTNGFTNVNVSAFGGVTWTSSDTSVATITAAGTLTPLKPGTTTISGAYGGLTNQSAVSIVVPPGYKLAEIIHRYSFNEAPDTALVEDIVGNADGTIVNLAAGTPGINNFNGTGQLVLVGAGNSQTPTSAYVNLPNGLVSGLNSLTIEGWVTWNGAAGSSWQRIFDIGMSSGAADGMGGFLEDSVANPGRAYMFLTPRSGGNTFLFAIKQGTDAETPNLPGGTAFTVGEETHFAMVYDLPAGAARLYRNGVRVGTAAATLPLSVVDDRNVWLGRAQWVDPMFNGAYNEFRIYDGVMFDAEIAATFAAGPNALPEPPVAKPALTIHLSQSNVIIEWPTEGTTGFALERTAVLGAGAGWSTDGIPAAAVVGAVNRVTIPASGNFYYRLKE